ncbi:hypothetical protein OUZ56_012195 [Daphnia magna]|uniref:Uncharacterized protein n=1 Tax=Daphnia magna TaxID=35525 RepID=A0ABQ9Z2L9_9CRUS|nr:hypothetical protein OUZ56_012195 [Daphnia magna]
MQHFEIARKAEEERMQQLETARKAEKRRVEAARKERQLQMELENQRYTGSLLRKQLADELAVADETDEMETSGCLNPSVVPSHPPVTLITNFRIPCGTATSTQRCSQHETAASKQPSTSDQPSSSIPKLNANASSYVPPNVFNQPNPSIDQQFTSSACPSLISTTTMSKLAGHNRVTQQVFLFIDVTMVEYFVQDGVKPTPQQGSHLKTRKNVHRPSSEKQKKSTTTPIVFSTTVKIASFPHCDGAHRLYVCEKFKALNPTERSEIVKEKRCCYRCLDDRHLSSDYTMEKGCGTDKCKRLHHLFSMEHQRCTQKRH